MMNGSEDAREVYVTMEWEFVPASVEPFDLIKTIWLDVAGTCSYSELPIGADEGPLLDVTTEPWSSSFTAQIPTIWNHIHDGGTHQQVYIGGKTVCESTAKYGESPGFISHADNNGHDHGQIVHLSSMSSCNNLGGLVQGDELTVTAFYNLSAHVPMTMHNGGLEPIMGVSVLYAARPWDEAMKEILADTGPADKHIETSLPLTRR
jgi:hypothetical protein